MGETVFKGRALTYLRKRGAYCKKNWGSAFVGSGVLDIDVCYRGFFVAFELKNPDMPIYGASSANDKYAEPAQREHLQAVRDSGGLAFVVNSISQIEVVLDVVDRRIVGEKA